MIYSRHLTVHFQLTPDFPQLSADSARAHLSVDTAFGVARRNVHTLNAIGPSLEPNRRMYTSSFGRLKQIQLDEL